MLRSYFFDRAASYGSWVRAWRVADRPAAQRSLAESGIRPPSRYARRRDLIVSATHLAVARGDVLRERRRMAERVGFEPTVEFPLHTLSKRAPSTTRPSLRVESTTYGHAWIRN